MRPLVSILIPAYNSEKWISETLQSAVKQVWNNKEVIVVDDGSTDRTLEIARRFESASVKVVSQPNSGACAARNLALSLAQGDYIQWLDSDDLIHPEKLQHQVARLQREECDPTVLFTSAFGEFYYRTAKAFYYPNSLWRDLTPVEWFLGKFGNDHFLFPAVWLVSRHLIEKTGGWDERLTLDDDGEYFGRLVAASSEVKFVPEACSYYRQANANSISRTINRKARESLLLSYRLLIGYFLGLEDSERTRKAVLSFLQINQLYFYPEEPQLVQEVHALAASLGGALTPPVLGAKYRPISRVFGFRWAKQVAWKVNAVKRATLRAADRIMFGLEGFRYGAGSQ